MAVAWAVSQDPDPVVLDVPIAYVKRPLPVDAQGALQGSDLRELRTFNIGADLYVRERAAVSAAEINVTERITQGSGLYDVRDLEVSWDGATVVFAMRGPFVAGCRRRGSADLEHLGVQHCGLTRCAG